ncbi:MAG: TlpA family protein disulfide reductase [Methylococcaceae bacterium]|nr:TlpA family protein disulfide reductase [Methylococcaceae bacterium]MDP3904462.1 TlpA family protein disulfide reductase [Methylococcaceae bacterium]
MKSELLGHKAPLLSVSDWVQGDPVNFDQLIGRVVLVEVFQVNCPGCFLYSLPTATKLHQRYVDQGLSVLGVATAFEDFDKNTLENLTRLAETGAVVGETLQMLTRHGLLIDGQLSYQIPFPLGMDRLQKCGNEVTQTDIDDFIHSRIPDFSLQSETYQQQIRERVEQYLHHLIYRAETFERFELKGTPSHILVDKQGILRDCAFGDYPDLEARIVGLLKE